MGKELHNCPTDLNLKQERRRRRRRRSSKDGYIHQQRQRRIQFHENNNIKIRSVTKPSKLPRRTSSKILSVIFLLGYYSVIVLFSTTITKVVPVVESFPPTSTSASSSSSSPSVYRTVIPSCVDGTDPRRRRRNIDFSSSLIFLNPTHRHYLHRNPCTIRGGGDDNSSSSSSNNHSGNDPVAHTNAVNNGDSTSTNMTANDNINQNSSSSASSASSSSSWMTPRSRSCILMSLAMALHFGGYEFCRSGAMALFTSTESSHGFGTISAAYPFAMGLVTPVSLSLLYGYGIILKSDGPRQALKVSTAGSISVLGLCSSILLYIVLSGIGRGTTAAAGTLDVVTMFQKAIMAILFVFQNSYAHLIYTQQWSFLGSVMTPTEGTKWFSLIAGLSSFVCTVTAKMVPTLLSWFGRIQSTSVSNNDTVGLLGLIFGTCVTLLMSLVFADWAYSLAEQNGFDPKPTESSAKPTKSPNDNGSDKNTSKGSSETESLLSKTRRMFNTSKTLSGLFCEVISFQSLSTVLNVCFVRQLQQSVPIDSNRAGFTSQFYALVNGSSGLMQFFVLPLARKYLEPRLVYRFLPALLMPLLVFSAITITTTTTTVAAATTTASSMISIPFLPSMEVGLFFSALAFFALKSTDYSIRNVANELVYQPLSFDERYLGKEVNGVVANRAGKSGSSMVLSWITMLFPGSWGRTAGVAGSRHLSQLAVGVGAIWSVCSVWLSRFVMTNQQAELKIKTDKTDDGLENRADGNKDDSKKIK